MDDLARWLSAQLDEDERIARAARGRGEGRWHHDTSYSNGYVYDAHNQPVVYDESTPSPEEARHIAEHDPARVLREIDAKRGILEEHRPSELAVYAPHGCPLCHAWPCATVRLMASVYRNREGYQEEWAP